MKTCYIYIRVSTDKQAEEGYSLDNQKRACVNCADSKGYHVKQTFVDNGRSGRTMSRPAFQELLTTIKEHPADAVIIYKIDRFARNVADFSNTRKKLESMSVELISVMEGDISKGSSLVSNIFASVAEWESEVNGERTRDALMQKFRGGWQPTPPPHAYLSVGGRGERKTCKPDPYVAPIIVELFQLYATGGYSICEIQEWLSDKNIVSKNGTSLGHSVINNILKNPFYYGLIRWKGQSKMGKHKPIIKKELFDTCQYVLAKHRNFLIRNRKYNFLLRGFIFCGECGQRYTAEWHYNAHKLKKRGGKIAYYHCQKRDRNGCPAPYVEISKLEGQVEKAFKTMQFSQEFIEAVVRKTREILDNNRKEFSSRRLAILNKKTALEAKRNRLEDRLLDGTIDRETFKRKHSGLKSKILNFDEQIQDLEGKSFVDVNLIEEVLAFTRNIYKTYKEAPIFLKRHYLRFFFEKIIVKNRRVSELIPTPIFAVLQENHQVIIREGWLRGLDSNQ
ncbi:recombinase family protein [Patescibacteria group bacterium]|nr:recombinase family protein [Patescibacteria group bacterium]